MNDPTFYGAFEMLVLSRRKDEGIVVDGPCRITVVDIRGDKVRLAINADKSVAIDRDEVRAAKERDAVISAEDAIRNSEVA